jgi:hypothetical protein
MNCDEFKAQLTSAILDRGASGPRAAAVEHAASCAACRRTLQVWEEAQRAIESNLGTNKVDPVQLRTMAESLYAERFGTALELQPKMSPVAQATPVSAQIILAVAAGLALGFLVWGGGTGSQTSALSQLMLQEALSGGGRPGMFPGMLAMAGASSRDIFAICMVIWISRSRLWSLLFPIAQPQSLYLVRRAAILLVIIGFYKLAGDAVVGPVNLMFRGRGFGLDPGGLFATLGIGWLLASAIWRVGFWVFVFTVTFIVIENLSLAYLKTGDSAPPRR